MYIKCLKYIAIRFRAVSKVSPLKSFMHLCGLAQLESMLYSKNVLEKTMVSVPNKVGASQKAGHLSNH